MGFSRFYAWRLSGFECKLLWSLKLAEDVVGSGV